MLGGTTESRRLVAADVGHGWISSVAGRTRQARAGGEGVRVGGFGGVAGLVDYLRAEGIGAVVNATHPFAATMTAHAFEACRQAGTPLVRLLRPGWADHPLAESWTWVDSHAEAARALKDAHRPLLTVGRQPLPHYRALPRAVARVAEHPGGVWPDGWEFIEAVGPFALDSERELLGAVDALVSKDAGGSDAKLVAAAEHGVPVVMIRRPELPDGSVVVADQGGVLAWLDALA